MGQVEFLEDPSNLNVASMGRKNITKKDNKKLKIALIVIGFSITILVTYFFILDRSEKGVSVKSLKEGDIFKLPVELQNFIRAKR